MKHLQDAPDTQSRQSSIGRHLRDILILPVTVTVIVPYLIRDGSQEVIPNHWIFSFLGWLIVVPAILLFLHTVNLFRKKGKGTLAPWSPTQKLIISGPYKYCRNPMITGVFFILVGEALIQHSLNILIWAGVFFLINTIYFIYIEEPSMHRRFGDQYLEYKKKVPRWIPRFTKN